MFLIEDRPIGYSDPWVQPLSRRFSQLKRGSPRVAYYYDQPDNSTFRYRVYNMIQALAAGESEVSASYFCQADLAYDDQIIDACDFLVVCRAKYGHALNRLISKARGRGRKVFFDVDDLIFDTRYAHLIVNTLDQDLNHPQVWDFWFSYIGRIGAALRLCDHAIVTNESLAACVADFNPMPVSVIPNFLNLEQTTVSDEVYARKVETKFARDDKFHLGYFSGTPTHNRDFAIIAETLAQLLRHDSRLVLRVVGYFTMPDALRDLADRIEVHPFQDFVNLQRLIGSTEINLIPLQSNIFTNCKSNLKYFEAGIVGSASIASSTGTLRHSIRDGVNGYLANTFDWTEKIYRVIDNMEDYADMASAAYQDVRHAYHWSRQLGTIEYLVKQPAFNTVRDMPPDRDLTGARNPNLFSMFDASGFGLEIGPSYNPLLPKSAGFNIETLDYADQAGLIEKFKDDPNVDTSRIEPVDYVWDGRSMLDIIGQKARYDYILASHVIEHTPDLLRFLNDCSALLKKAGKLVLIVPDAMSCFDVLRPLSSTGQILQAHIDRHERHPPGIGFDHQAYITTRGGYAGWAINDNRPLQFQHSLDEARSYFERLRGARTYNDLHRWQFTPNSFRLIVNDLVETGYIDLKEAAFHAPAAGYEFYVSLSRDGEGPGRSRIDLGRAMLQDLRRLPRDA
jgi:glycosyltransferase involved in cell wall biosynthesis